MISLLLLDLDGVVVYEMVPPHVKKRELILLHDLLVNGLQAVGVPVVVPDSSFAGRSGSYSGFGRPL